MYSICVIYYLKIKLRSRAIWKSNFLLKQFVSDFQYYISDFSYMFLFFARERHNLIFFILNTFL